jgi:hypothetical protein
MPTSAQTNSSTPDTTNAPTPYPTISGETHPLTSTTEFAYVTTTPVPTSNISIPYSPPAPVLVNITVTEVSVQASEEPVNITLPDGVQLLVGTMNASSQFTLSVKQSSLLPSTLERGMVIMSRVLVLDFPSSVQLKFPVAMVMKSTLQSTQFGLRRRLLVQKADAGADEYGVINIRRKILSHLEDSNAKVGCFYRANLLYF